MIRLPCECRNYRGKIQFRLRQDAGAIIDTDGNNLARYGEPQNFGLTVEASL